MKMIPLAKQSKAAQRRFYLAQRGSWNGISPVTRIAKSGKGYNRNSVKQQVRKEASQ